MKIAIIISGGGTSKQGITGIALSRGELLSLKHNYDIDYFLISSSYRKLSLKSFFYSNHILSEKIIDNKKVKIITKIEYYTNIRGLRRLLKNYYSKKKYRLLDWEWHKTLSKYFKNYDAIIAHSNDAAIIADNVKQKYGIPYFVTWHGSDIHSRPFIDEFAITKTISAIENANCNFFVSNSLLRESDKLTLKGEKVVIYNGINSCFYKYDNAKLEDLKSKYNPQNKKIVTFVGNFLPIKNADLLPDIFLKISKEYKDRIEFWIIGDGPLKIEIQHKIENYKLDCVLWGRKTPSEISDFLNLTDVFILPSKNEGLPLVILESLACGANAVGSNVGGIIELLGKDFCVDISETFVDDFADKVVSVLETPITQPYPGNCTWTKIVQKEYEIYKKVLE